MILSGAYCKLFPPMNRPLQLVIVALLVSHGLLHARDAARNASDEATQQAPAQSRIECHHGVEILSNTMGVDFRHYSERIVQQVRQHWYKVMPDVARTPISKKGVVVVEFAIEKGGQVNGSHIATSSGDVSLDRAAWTGFTASTPFPPLPSEFKGESVAVRFCFF